MRKRKGADKLQKCSDLCRCNRTTKRNEREFDIQSSLHSSSPCPMIETEVETLLSGSTTPDYLAIIN